MNEFALNSAPINGQGPQDVSLEGNIGIDLVCAFEGIRGAGMVADGLIELDLTASMSSGMVGTGTVDIELDGGLAPSMLTMITGDMPVDMQASMAGAVRRAITGNIPISFIPCLDLTRWAMGKGDITIAFGLTGDGRIVQRVNIEGTVGIVLDPLLLDGRRTAAIMPDMPLAMDVSVAGPAALEMRGGGSAEVDVVLKGISRLGGKVNIAGSASIELITRGIGRQYTLVPIEGISDIQFLLVSERAGRPTIPTEYVPAPADRRFVVARQPRERRVVYDRML